MKHGPAYAKLLSVIEVTMADDRMFKEALNAINTGQRARARDLLTRLLRTDQNNTDYWLYMSTVVDTRKEQVYCLENVLKYDHNNETAIRGLIFIGELPPDENLKPVKPVRERDWSIEEMYEGGEEEGIIPAKEYRTTLPLAQGLSLGVAALIVTGLMIIGFTGNPFFMGVGQSQVSNNVSYQPLFTAGPTRTGFATETVEGSSGPAASIATPTQLTFLVNDSYTTTPRYVNTPHPDDPNFDRAMQALDRGNYNQAIELFGQVVDNNPVAFDA